MWTFKACISHFFLVSNSFLMLSCTRLSLKRRIKNDVFCIDDFVKVSNGCLCNMNIAVSATDGGLWLSLVPLLDLNKPYRIENRVALHEVRQQKSMLAGYGCPWCNFRIKTGHGACCTYIRHEDTLKQWIQ